MVLMRSFDVQFQQQEISYSYVIIWWYILKWKH